MSASEMIFWFIILFVDGIDGFPNGAPTSACTTLTPRHADVTPQTSKAPYQIRAELSDQKITAHISSSVGEKFEGFIIQVHSSTNPNQFIDGEFTKSQVSKTINCFDTNQNTLTHVNNEPKMEIMTEWTPRKPLKEAIIFRATIAKRYDTFWTEIDSNSVMLESNSTSVEEESRSPMQESLYEKCFKEEGCIGLPQNCIEREDCEVLLRYHKSPDAIEFNLQGPLETSRYMAMAFSDDDSMGEDKVTECIRDGTDVIARESWNAGKSNTRTRDLDRKQYIGTYVDGLTSCSWATPLITVSDGQTYDFTNKRFYILLATGEINEWRLRYHAMQLASSEALNLTEFQVPAEIPGPEVENSSRQTTEFQHPPTTAGYEIGSSSQKGSSNDKKETSTTENRSSCSNMSLMLFITGLFFAAMKNIVYF